MSPFSRSRRRTRRRRRSSAQCSLKCEIASIVQYYRRRTHEWRTQKSIIWDHQLKALATWTNGSRWRIKAAVNWGGGGGCFCVIFRVSRCWWGHVAHLHLRSQTWDRFFFLFSFFFFFF
jgi:hypothetical protein